MLMYLTCFSDVNPISGETTGEVAVEEQMSFLLCVYETPPDKTKQTCIGILVFHWFR